MAEGLVEVEAGEPLSSFSINEKGHKEADALRQSRIENPATAFITLDPNKFSRLPTRRFAGRVYFDEKKEFLPVGLTFFDRLDELGRGRALVDFLMPNGPRELLQSGRRLVWWSGDEEVGRATLVCGSKIERPPSVLVSAIVDQCNRSNSTPRRQAA